MQPLVETRLAAQRQRHVEIGRLVAIPVHGRAEGQTRDPVEQASERVLDERRDQKAQAIAELVDATPQVQVAYLIVAVARRRLLREEERVEPISKRRVVQIERTERVALRVVAHYPGHRRLSVSRLFVGLAFLMIEQEHAWRARQGLVTRCPVCAIRFEKARHLLDTLELNDRVIVAVCCAEEEGVLHTVVGRGQLLEKRAKVIASFQLDEYGAPGLIAPEGHLALV